MPVAPGAIHPSTQEVPDAARQRGLEIEVRQFGESTRTAQEAAQARREETRALFLNEAPRLLCAAEGTGSVYTYAGILGFTPACAWGDLWACVGRT
jgi:short subunit dehydrogenase-like uncharacterized protein